MRSLATRQFIPWVPLAIGAVLVALISFAIVSMAKVAAQTQLTEGERLLTIHDGDQERVILTTETTVERALNKAHIPLDPKDLVEPGRDHELVASNYAVNIYRARPVTIIDGSVRQKVLSPYHTATQIAKQAGIQLYPEDTAAVSVQAGAVTTTDTGLEMTVDRATPFTFTLYGKTTTARTQATTVGDMLKEKHITLGANDRVSVPTETPVTPDLAVRVWREGKQTVTVEEEVNFDTEKIKDADRPIEYKEVQTPGVKGARNVTYEIVVQDGKEVSRTEIASLTTKEPVKQVEIVGTKLPTPTNPTEAQALGHQMMLAYGFGEDQWPCLVNLWNHESGWRVNASNPSGAYGIPQALPGSKMGAGWQTDAAVQIQWGLGYIKGRYGTPCGALGAWQSKGWY